MVKYVSTRTSSAVVDGATAVLRGIAGDGGSFVPQTLPVLDVKELCDLCYAARANVILREFFDFGVDGIAKSVYGDDDSVPTVKIDDNAFVSELWHGKSYSSKDIALAVLPQLFDRAKAALRSAETTLIPVATNGDMGKSVCEAFKEASGTEVCVFYPESGMDELHKKELLAVDGRNITVVGVSANFNGVQSAVKNALCDRSLADILAENGKSLSSANSVNIGIIVPQIVYFFSAYCDLVNSGEIRIGDKIDFVTPTGNFGGTLAGYYAVKMGLPVNRLVCASCGHNALIDFINSGVYDITDRTAFAAPVLGNLERLIFEISGRDEVATAKRFDELKSSGRFSVTESEIDEIRQIFAGDCVDEEDVRNAIADMFEEYGYLADTHTAVACEVALRREFVRPTVILSTTNPYRSALAVMNALGEKTNGYDEKLFRRLEDLSALDVPPQLISALTAKKLHDEVISPQDISKFLKERYCKK